MEDLYLDLGTKKNTKRQVFVFIFKSGFLYRMKTTKNSENIVKLKPEGKQFIIYVQSTQSNETRSKYNYT